MTLTIPQVELYPHNRETYNKICDMWKTTDKVAAIQATGTGKTYLQLQCLYDYNDALKVVLAPSNYILDQLIAKSDGNLRNTLLLTYAKLSQMSFTEIEALKPSLIVLDEFHRCGADEWGKGVDKLLTAFQSSKVLGTSATPIRYLDGARNMADEIFEGKLVVNSNLTDAWARGVLPRPKYVTALYTFAEEAESVQTKIANSSNDEESKKELIKRLDELKRNLDMSVGVPQILCKHISGVGGKYIVFCKDKAHLKEMEPLVIDWFLDAGIADRVDSYRVLHGEVSNSEELMRFKENTNSINVRLLFSIEMLNEGIHVDDITGVILLRPTVSPIIHFQQMGRAFSTGQTNEPLIFDLVNNVASIHSDDLRKEFQVSVEREIIRRKAAGIEDLHIPEFNIIDETLDVLGMFAALEAELQDDWDAKFEALKAYLEKNGEHPNTQTSLGSWTNYMRNAMKGKIGCKLNQYRIDRLNSIGFIWDVNFEEWGSNFKSYAEIMRIGDKHKPLNEKLVRWSRTQRVEFRKARMLQYRIDKLNSIGFLWEPFDELWESNFKRYATICESGNIRQIDSKNSSWATSQRTSFHRGEMSQYHIDKLNSIGFNFVFVDNDALWKRGYNEFLKYKEQYKNSYVPRRYVINGFKLGIWVLNKRQKFKKGKLSQDHIDKLNAIGFVWEVPKELRLKRGQI